MYYAVIIVGIVGCVAFLVIYRKKQAAAAGAGRPPQKGIIR